MESTSFHDPDQSDPVSPALENMIVLKFPAFVKAIAAEAFHGLAAEAILIPDGCTAVESKAFLNCKHLPCVALPISVEIPGDAIKGCPNVAADHG